MEVRYLLRSWATHGELLLVGLLLMLLAKPRIIGSLASFFPRESYFTLYMTSLERTWIAIKCCWDYVQSANDGVPFVSAQLSL